MEFNNNLKINEYVSIAQLKRKLKTYFSEQGNSDFKPSIFAQGLILSLVMILEELVGDCLKLVNKEKSGLYTINHLILSNLFSQTDKYEFASKYMRKYSSTLRYHESIFFNFNKVITNIEDKHGSKLMVEIEARNIIAYIILSLQYDIIGLSVRMVKYAGRKTLNINVLDIVCSYMLSNEISNKIKLKLDSINISNGTEEVDEIDSDENEVDNEADNEADNKTVNEAVNEVENKVDSIDINDVELEPVKEEHILNEHVKEKKKKTRGVEEINENNKIVKENVIDVVEEKSVKKSKSKTK